MIWNNSTAPKSSLKQTVGRSVFVGGVLVALSSLVVPRAYAEPQEVKLTDEQQSAKAVFMGEMGKAVAEYKKYCGKDLALTVDFENYKKGLFENYIEKKNRQPSSKEEIAEYIRNRKSACTNGEYYGSFGGACSAVVDQLASACRRENDDGKDARGGKDEKNARMAGVTKVACLWGGTKPREPDEDCSLTTERNMSFENNAITFHIAPEHWSANSAVHHTVNPMKLPDSRRVNGSVCTKPSECATLVCGAGKCKTCETTTQCPSGATCQTGQCMYPSAPDSDPAPASKGGSSKPETKTLKALGEKCASNFDCKSKICGMISSGQNHKCVAKH
jgi:hypothetical protein